MESAPELNAIDSSFTQRISVDALRFEILTSSVVLNYVLQFPGKAVKATLSEGKIPCARLTTSSCLIRIKT